MAKFVSCDNDARKSYSPQFFFISICGLEFKCDVKISEVEYGGVSTQLSSIMTLVKEYSLILQKKGIIKLFFIAKFILLITISISKGALKN